MKCLKGLKFECVGDTQTDEERVIFSSFKNFADVVTQIEDERDRMVSLLFIFTVEWNFASGFEV